MAVGFLITATIAALGNRAQTTVLLLLTLLAGIFQYAGASKFHAIGKADPTLARASVRRLIHLGVRARNAREAAEIAYEEGSATDAKRLMGIISTVLSTLEEGILEAVEDWREFHREALNEIDAGGSE